MKILYRFVADIIWVIHFGVVLIALFGWLLPSLWGIYMAILIAIVASGFLFNYCFLSKWEFDLRKKIYPDLNYNYSYTSYYTYKFTGRYIAPEFLRIAGLTFATISLLINYYFYFLY